MEYNSLQKDWGFEKKSKEEAIEVLKNLKDNWIYIKSSISYLGEKYLKEVFTNYNKFKLNEIVIDKVDNNLYLYGKEDEDKIILKIDKIIQTEITKLVKDEVKIIIKEEELYLEFYIKKFVPNIERLDDEIFNSKENLIITEGKTDWKHLKAALIEFRNEKLYLDLDVKFFEYEKNLADYNENLKNENLGGAKTLEIICKYVSLFPNEKTKIFIFDPDDEKLVKKYKTEKGYYKLGNNVYIVLLPIPDSRKKTPFISIENYYTDEEIKIKDKKGRRLYLSNEFSFNKNLFVYSRKVDYNRPNLIIDDEVYETKTHYNIQNKEELTKLIKENKLEKIRTLSKNEFAENILNKIPPFDKISKKNFKNFFNIIESILVEAENLRKDLKENINLEKNVILQKYGNHCELHLLVKATLEEIKIYKNTQFKKFYVYKQENDIIISWINFDSEYILAKIKINLEFLKFIEKKIENASNRVYLHLYNNNEELSLTEILKGDGGYLAFCRIYNQVFENNRIK